MARLLLKKLSSARGYLMICSLIALPCGSLGIDINNSQKYTIVFNPDGTGTSICCDNSSISTITWQVDANGLLNFIETDDEGNKYIMQLYPIIHADFKFMIKVNTPTGQEDSLNVKVLINGTKQ